MLLARCKDKLIRRTGACCLVWMLSLSLLLLFAARALAQATDAGTVAALVRAGHYDEAISQAERVLKIHPGDPALRAVEGIAYSLEGKDTEALAALHGALRLVPGYPAALKAEAEILVREHSAEAVPVLAQILKAHPEDGTAREMLALEQARKDQCDDALPNFEQVGQAMHEHPDSLASYGACLFKAERFAAAARAFAEVLALQPENKSARYDLALAETRAGQGKEAVDTLKPLLGEADVETLLLASDVLEDTGNTPEAVSTMRRAIVLEPARAESYVRFAELCMLHESYEPGIAVVSAGMARLPRDASLVLARGMLYGGLAEYGKAEADFRSAEALDPHHGTGSYGVGLVQAQSNHADQALATARAGLRAHPEDAQLNLLLARLLIEGGAAPGQPPFAEAAEAAAKAVRLRPDLVAGRDLLAKVDGMQGQTAAAIEQYKAALRLDPSDQIALYRLMRATRQMGDSAGAEALVRRIEEGHKQAREDEGRRLRYRIVESGGPDAAGDGSAGRSAERSVERPAQRTVERTAERTVERSAERPAEPHAQP